MLKKHLSILLLSCICSTLLFAQNNKIKWKQVQKGKPTQIAQVGTDSLGHWVDVNFIDSVYINNDSLVTIKNGKITSKPLPVQNGVILDTIYNANGFQTTISLNTHGSYATGLKVGEDLNGSGWRTFNTNGTLTNIYYAHAPGGAIHYTIFGNGTPGKLMPSLPPMSSTALTAVATSTNTILVKWNKVPKATGYQLEYGYNGYVFAIQANPPPTDSFYIHTQLPPATTVFYRLLVQPDSLHSKSDYSNTVSATTFTPPSLQAPAVTVTALNATTARLNWNNVPNEAFYQVQSSDDNVEFNTIATLPADTVTYIDRTLTPQSSRYYRVLAGADNINFSASAYSATAITTTPALVVLPKPTLSITNVTASSLKLNWSANANESGMAIYTSTDTASGYELLTLVPSGQTSYTDDTLTSNTKIFYKAYRMGDSVAYNNSLFSNVVSATTSTLTPIAKPSLTATAISSSQINLSWTASAGAGGYLINWSSDKSNWQLLTQTDAGVLTAQHTNLSASTQIYYEIQGLSPDVNHSNSVFDIDSATTQAGSTNATTLATPTVTATAASTTQINISWSNVANESGYTLYRSTDNVTFSIVATFAANVVSYNHTSLLPGTKYYWHVVANGDGVNFSNSLPGSANATTLADQTAVATKMGVMLTTGGIGTNMTGMNNMGVDYVRASHDGGNVTYDTYTKGGFNALLSYNTARPGDFTALPTDTSDFACKLDSILTEVGTTKLIGVAMINEYNNVGYWITSAKNVINLLKAGANVAHEHGLKAYDGGLGGGPITRYMVWEDYINRGLKDSAALYASLAFEPGTNLTNWRSSSNFGPKIRFMDTILANIRSVPTDAFNMHWYETTRDVDSNLTSTSTLPFVAAARFYSRVSGKPIVTNEYGLNNTSSVTLMQQQVDVVTKILHMEWAFWFSHPAHPLTDGNGNLTPLGTAFKNKLATLP